MSSAKCCSFRLGLNVLSVSGDLNMKRTLQSLLLKLADHLVCETVYLLHHWGWVLKSEEIWAPINQGRQAVILTTYLTANPAALSWRGTITHVIEAIRGEKIFLEWWLYEKLMFAKKNWYEDIEEAGK